MTKVYFVRHAQPDHDWADDRPRPLTSEGEKDAGMVLDILRDKEMDCFFSSPYKRSMDIIREAAAYFGKEILTDERFREREKGPNGNEYGMVEKRWQDRGYHEPGGESIAMVQERNVAALKEILAAHKGESIVIGTHGTALSSIFSFYWLDFGCQDFFRIIDWMPYIVELDFSGDQLVSVTELGHIKKMFKGKERADKGP